MPSKFHSASFIERLVAALSYLTMGLVGFVWIIIGIFTKSQLRSFMRFHIFQSIFLSLAYFLFSTLLVLLMSGLSIIPFVNKLVLAGYYYLNMPVHVFLGFSLIEMTVYTVIFYLVITSLFGKYSYLPWVSDIIRANVGE